MRRLFCFKTPVNIGGRTFREVDEASTKQQKLEKHVFNHLEHCDRSTMVWAGASSSSQVAGLQVANWCGRVPRCADFHGKAHFREPIFDPKGAEASGLPKKFFDNNGITRRAGGHWPLITRFRTSSSGYGPEMRTDPRGSTASYISASKEQRHLEVVADVC